MERWGDLSGNEKQAIWEELNRLVTMFRALKQDAGDHYIGMFTQKDNNSIEVNLTVRSQQVVQANNH